MMTVEYLCACVCLFVYAVHVFIFNVLRFSILLLLHRLHLLLLQLIFVFFFSCSTLLSFVLFFFALAKGAETKYNVWICIRRGTICKSTNDISYTLCLVPSALWYLGYFGVCVCVYHCALTGFGLCVCEREPRKKYVCFVYALSFVGFWFWIHIWYKILRTFSIPSSVIFVFFSSSSSLLLPSSVIFAVFCRFFISFSSVCTSVSFICVPFGESRWKRIPVTRFTGCAFLWKLCRARVVYCFFFSSSLFRFICVFFSFCFLASLNGMECQHILHRLMFSVMRSTRVLRCHCFQIHYCFVASIWKIFGNWHLQLLLLFECVSQNVRR